MPKTSEGVDANEVAKHAARQLLVRLIDTFDNQEFGGQHPVTFGDMRLIIGYAESALDALNRAPREEAS